MQLKDTDVLSPKQHTGIIPNLLTHYQRYCVTCLHLIFIFTDERKIFNKHTLPNSFVLKGTKKYDLILIFHISLQWIFNSSCINIIHQLTIAADMSCSTVGSSIKSCSELEDLGRGKSVAVVSTFEMATADSESEWLSSGAEICRFLSASSLVTVVLSKMHYSTEKNCM